MSRILCSNRHFLTDELIQHAIDGKHAVYISPFKFWSLDHKKTVIKELKQRGISFKHTEDKITFESGGTITFLGVAQEEKLRGLPTYDFTQLYPDRAVPADGADHE